MKKLKFKKEYSKWFIIYPEWEGSKDDLEMVEGADVLLDILSSNGDSIELEVSTNEELDFPKGKLDSKLELISICPNDGAYYKYSIGYQTYLKSFKRPKCPPTIDVQPDFYEPLSEEKFVKIYSRSMVADQTIWLCNVTKFVLGDFPEVIYFRING